MKNPTIFLVLIFTSIGIIIDGCSTKPTQLLESTSPSVTPTKSDSAKEPWQRHWDNVVTEAKKERSVSIMSNWGPESREAVIWKLRERFGIEAEVSSAGASQAGEKILSERRVGLYNYDISLHGANFGVNLMKPSGAFDPAPPALILPEVKDPKAWFGGEFPWFDRDRTMIPFFSSLDMNLSVNTDLVKPGEIASYKDLLDPKWKGRILLRDPTTIGAGSGWFRENGKDLGLDYMRALVKQEPKILGDDRQLAEWLARGKYSVLIAANPPSLTYFMKEGAPIAIVDAQDSRSMPPASGIVSLMNRAPHPSGAKLFINWILTKEGQTIMTQTVGLASRRLDAPTDHISPAVVPRQGRKYTEYSEESVARDAEALRLSKEIFGPLLGK